MSNFPGDLLQIVLSHILVVHHHYDWSFAKHDVFSPDTVESYFAPPRHALRDCPYSGCFCAVSVETALRLRQVCSSWNREIVPLFHSVGIDLTDQRARSHFGSSGVVNFLESHRFFPGDTAALMVFNFSGCYNLTDALLERILRRHGAALRALDLSFCPQLTAAAYNMIVSMCSALEALNVRSSPRMHMTPATVLALARLNGLRLLDISHTTSVELGVGNRHPLADGGGCTDPNTLRAEEIAQRSEENIAPELRRHYGLKSREELEWENAEYFGLTTPPNAEANEVTDGAEAQEDGGGTGRELPGADPPAVEYTSVVSALGMHQDPFGQTLPAFSMLRVLVVDAPLLDHATWTSLFRALLPGESPLHTLVLGMATPVAHEVGALVWAFLFGNATGLRPDAQGVVRVPLPTLDCLAHFHVVRCPLAPPVRGPVLPPMIPLNTLSALEIGTAGEHEGNSTCPCLLVDPLCTGRGGRATTSSQTIMRALRASAPGLVSLTIALTARSDFDLMAPIDTVQRWFPALRRLAIEIIRPPDIDDDGREGIDDDLPTLAVSEPPPAREPTEPLELDLRWRWVPPLASNPTLLPLLHAVLPRGARAFRYRLTSFLLPETPGAAAAAATARWLSDDGSMACKRTEMLQSALHVARASLEQFRTGCAFAPEGPLLLGAPIFAVLCACPLLRTLNLAKATNVGDAELARLLPGLRILHLGCLSLRRCGVINAFSNVPVYRVPTSDAPQPCRPCRGHGRDCRHYCACAA